MRRLAGYIDLSDLLCLLGVACIAVTVYVLWAVWVWAFIGAALLAAGVLRDLGRVRSGSDGTRR